ncbi:hypothetical protein L207DRAFT_582152 [Hyaloscypha variabilis F]|uniref:Extracellular membrane protein CFEM domain-containing protein n=1 Tax=Hyaloscypha variabilis (strain UAMH 11265 / GT02V1 / F) TaxID=1149755 RepID=A0A2J6RT76_HYAVF|nr:hypothetical protein L207DRAFT_582152 [Hyaloscypha variabilis F]
MVRLLLSLTLAVRLVFAQDTFNPSMCVSGSGITTFPNCNYFSETSDQCNSYSIRSQLLACYCNQPLLNAIYNCESEARICFGDDDEDTVIQNDLATWHNLCDTYITFSPTTPLVSTVSGGTVDFEACTVGESACARQSVLVTSCSLSAKGTSFFPCVCERDDDRGDNKLYGHNIDFTLGWVNAIISPFVYPDRLY